MYHIIYYNSNLCLYFSLQEKDIPVLKDNDFVKDGCKMYIGPDAKDKILEMLNADVMV